MLDFATMKPTDTALMLSLSSPQPVDVKFWVFSKRVRVYDRNLLTRTVVREPREVFGISSILKSRDYFQKLLSNGFAESAQNTHFYHPFPSNLEDRTDDYDYESDSDLDTESEQGDSQSEGSEFGDQPVERVEAMRGLSPTSDRDSIQSSIEPDENKLLEDPGPACQLIIIKDTAFLTWRALIYYLYTGNIAFLNLRSQDPLQRRAETKNMLCNLKNPGHVPACSPKSMYRLAEKLGLDDLRKRSLDAIGGRLLPRTILVEVFSVFTSRYHDVMLAELTYLCDNYHHKDIKEQWSTTVKRMLSMECGHANEALVTLLSTRLVPGSTPLARGYEDSFEEEEEEIQSQLPPASTSIRGGGRGGGRGIGTRGSFRGFGMRGR